MNRTPIKARPKGLSRIPANIAALPPVASVDPKDYRNAMRSAALAWRNSKEAGYMLLASELRCQACLFRNLSQ